MSIKEKLLQFFTLILTRWFKATEPQKLLINFLKLPGKDWRLFVQIGYRNKIQTKEKSLVKVTLFIRRKEGIDKIRANKMINNFTHRGSPIKHDHK